MEEKISVIVPVYNVEAYLESCVVSILQQSYQNFELILVDDGSKDHSGAMCDRLGALDERIKIIHQENQGLSGARNTGIDCASGQYLCFVDSDDRIHPQYLEILYHAITSQQADMSVCAYQKYFEDDELNIEPVHQAQPECWDRIRLMNELCTYEDSERIVYATVMWNKLYRRELFRELRFQVGKIHEDEYMISEILIRIHKAAACREKLYFYRQRKDSITGGASANEKSLHDYVEAIVQRCILLEVEKDNPAYAELINYYLGYMIHRYRSLSPDMKQYKKSQRFLRRAYRSVFLRYRRYVKIKRFYIFLFSPTLMALWEAIKDS